MGGFLYYRDNKKLTKKARKQIESAAKLLASRGPDSKGVWQDDYCFGVNYNRAPLGDKTKTLPITTKNYTVFFEGEIYNHQDIANKLGIKIDKTMSDGDIFGRYFDRFQHTQDIEGMFGFVFITKEAIYFGRDRYGLKSIYFTEQAGFFVSSQIKPLLHLTSHEADDQGIADYLKYGYSSCHQTVFHSIYQLLPGEIWVKRGNNKATRLTNRSKNHRRINNKVGPITDFKNIFFNRIKSVCRDEEKIGLCLSSGFDSRLIFEHLKKLDRELIVFSFGVPDSVEKFSRDINEAKRLSEQAGIEFHPVVFDQDTLHTKLERFLSELDYPCYNASGFIFYLLCERAKDCGIRLLLTGDGAEKYFNGSAHYSTLYNVGKLRQYLPRILFQFSPLKKGRQIACNDQDLFDWYKPIHGLSNSFTPLIPVDEHKNAGFTGYTKTPHGLVELAMRYDRENWLALMGNNLSNSISGQFGIEIGRPFQFDEFLDQQLVKRGYRKEAFFKEAFPDIDFLDGIKLGMFGPFSDLIRAAPIFTPEIAISADIPVSLANRYKKLYQAHLEKSGYYMNELWAMRTLFSTVWNL